MSATKTDVVSVIASVIGLAIAVYGVVTQPAVLDSVRPKPSAAGSGTPSNGPLTARLWDDPFAVFPDSSSSPDFPAMTGNSNLVLIVPAPTHPYEDAREQRIRMRFAIQRALLDCGYAPSDSSLLYSVPLKAGQSTVYLPAQVFQVDPLRPETKLPAKYQDILLIWYPDHLVRSRDQLGLLEVLKPDGLLIKSVQGHSGPRSVDYVVLGPADSDSLISLLQKPRGLPAPGSSDSDDREALWRDPSMQVRFLCSRATISDRAMDKILGVSLLQVRGPQSTYLVDGYIPLSLSAPRDNSVCHLLAGTIVDRARSLPWRRRAIVWLLAERDTVYGRALTSDFEDELHTAEKSVPSDQHVRLRAFPFLRGLDGASTLYAKVYTSEDAAPSKSQRPDPAIESAEGTTQFDYLRRITNATWNGSRLFSSECNEPDAVVIFGSDIYDKLVLLKFLRERLSVPTYFTTDLDALFWHPHYAAFTKGLVVASGYPLSIPTNLAGTEAEKDQTPATGLIQDPTFTFRDNYQTGLYHAVVSLLNTLCSAGFTQSKTRNSAASLAVDTAGQHAANDSVRRATGPVGSAIPCRPQLYRIGVDSAVTLPDPSEPPEAPDLVSPEGGHAGPMSSATGESSRSNPQSYHESSFGGVSPAAASQIISAFSLTFWLTYLKAAVFRYWSLLLGVTVIVLAVSTLWREIPRRMELPLELRDDLWKEAKLFMPADTHRDLDTTIERLRQALTDPVKLQRAQPATKLPFPSSQRHRFRWNGISVFGSSQYCIQMLAFYTRCLKGSECKTETIEIGLSLLSDVFALRGKPPEAGVQPHRFENDVVPFSNYWGRQFGWTFMRNARHVEGRIAPQRSTNDSKVFCDRPTRRLLSWLPSINFLWFLAPLFMLVAIILQPKPYFMGLSSHSFLYRLTQWGLDSLALTLTFLVFYRVCFEQWRFSHLVEDLAWLFTEFTGLSNRKIMLLMVKASESVTYLSVVPCALILLLFLAHVQPLGLHPMTGELAIYFATLLAFLAVSFFTLRSAALNARTKVLEQYSLGVVRASRLDTRLKSYATDAGPVQDDGDALRMELKVFAERNSTSRQGTFVPRVFDQLGNPAVRSRLSDYLRACGERDNRALAQIQELQSGIFAPLPLSPILSTLLIPVGGVGGLQLITVFVSYLKSAG